MLLCQTPQNIQLRKQFLEYFERIMHGVYSTTFNPKWATFGSSLVFIIKKYDIKGAFSKFLYDETYAGKDDFAVSGPYVNSIFRAQVCAYTDYHHYENRVLDLNFFKSLRAITLFFALAPAFCRF